MRRTLLFLLLLCHLPAIAQKIRFADTANTWTVVLSDPDGPVLKDLSRLTTDTMIGGNTYLTMWEPSFGGDIFVREDTATQKVFCIRSSVDTAERLLYDWTLQLNDTFRSATTVHHVSSIDSVEMDGEWYKAWHLALDTITGGLGLSYDQDIIEGIGSINGPGNPLDPTYFEMGTGLICFSHHGNVSPLSKKIGSLFNNGSSCNIQVGLPASVNVATNRPLIFPNPVDDEVTIILREKIYEIRIMDMSGRIFLTQHYADTEVHIPVTHLPPGIYILCINNHVRTIFAKE